MTGSDPAGQPVRRIRYDARTGYPAVVPVLAYPDVDAAVGWLCRTFGFAESLRWSGPDRVAAWAELEAGSGAVMVELGSAEGDLRSHRVVVFVEDAGRQHRRVVTAGGSPLRPPELKPEGVLEFDVQDLAGHRWTFASLVDVVEPAAWGAHEATPAVWPPQ